MIISVLSKDGDRLYTKIKAASTTQALAAREQLQAVAATRTSAELLADAYYNNPGCASLQLPCDECRAKVAA